MVTLVALADIVEIFEAIIAADILIQGVKTIRAWIAGIKKDIGNTSAFDEKTATIDETYKMSELLTKKKNEFINSCKKLENKLQTAMDSVFDKLIDSVEEISKDTGISINKESLKRDFYAKKKELKNSISNMVTRRIALDDSELLGILKQKPSPRRSQMIDRYIKKIVSEGFKKSEDAFSDAINQAFSVVKGRIDEKIQEKEKSESRYLGELRAMKLEKTKKEFIPREKRFKQEKKILDNLIHVLSDVLSETASEPG